MKLLRVTRIKVMTSKGKILKGDTVVLDDAEVSKITYMTPDAFEVLDENFQEPVAVVDEAPKPKRTRAKKAAE